MTSRPCLRCPEPTPVPHGLCPSCLAADSAASRAAQGLPARVEDVAGVERVAEVLRDAAAVRDVAS